MRAAHRRQLATAYQVVGNVVTPICRRLPNRLLGVWAHPDDECYLSAGLMARVVGAGGSVRLICATSGERGTDDPQLFGTDRFAQLRRRELRASLTVLGVDDVRFLGIADGACELVEADTVVSQLADEIAAFEPDTVVTFGPDGITGHPDHVAVSRWTTAAAAARPAVELMYATMTNDHVERHRSLHDELGLFGDFADGRPRSVPNGAVALQCALDHGELIRKRHALACHGSQTVKLAELVGEATYFAWWSTESFRRPTASERRSAMGRPDLVGAGS
jgi:LmbE family N-acetylglucosaminyl deacetylase